MAPPKISLVKRAIRVCVHDQEERVGFFATLADAIGHFEIDLVDLKYVIAIQSPVVFLANTLKRCNEPVLGRRKCFGHGSNLRMAGHD